MYLAKLIKEEEHSRNNIVMDHLNTLFARQDKLEFETNERLKNIENLIRGV